jgi:hypothetical protein
MGHDLAIVIMRNLFFIGLYGIDMDIIYLFVLFEYRCHVHCLNTNVICLFVLFKHECYVYLYCLHMKGVHTTFVFK